MISTSGAVGRSRTACSRIGPARRASRPGRYSPPVIPLAVADSGGAAAAAHAMSPAPPGPGSSEGKQTKQPAMTGCSGGRHGSGSSAASAVWAAIRSSAVSGHSGTQQRSGEAGGSSVALERQLRAIVDVDLDTALLERPADLRPPVDHDHDAGPHGKDVAAHRVVALAVDRDPLDAARLDVLQQADGGERLVDHEQLLGGGAQERLQVQDVGRTEVVAHVVGLDV